MRHPIPTFTDTFSPTSVFIRHFLLFLAPSLIFAGAAFGLFDYISGHSDLKTVRATQRTRVYIVRKLLEREFGLVITDLRFLAGHSLLQTHFDDPGALPLSLVTAQFDNIAASRGLYDQVRFIDSTGRERIRVNYHDGRTWVVADSELQDKSRRYYFQDAIRLPPDGIFISPMDLNIEHGEIERPFKPMIRFATPVFDGQGNKRGVVVINYFGDSIRARIREIFQDGVKDTDTCPGERGTPMLLNPQGFFLLAPDPADEWGFMFGRDTTFGKRFPEAWRTIAAMRAGQFSTGRGLFTFTTIAPLTGGDIATADKDDSSPAPAFRKGYFWKLVAYIDQRTLAGIEGRHHRLLIRLYGLMAAVLVVGCGFLARARVEKKEYELRLRRQALHDFLTGLPNRSLLFDRLEQAIVRHRREQRHFAVLFIDLDLFKEINDTLGHDAGDEALRVVADRLKNQVRASDTVARMGGDEFVVILEDVGHPRELERIAANIIAAIGEPFPLGRDKGRLGASIGGSMYPAHGATAEELIIQADKAMYAAKQNGRNRYRSAPFPDGAQQGG